MNRLRSEKSAYLRHAADQEIDWHPWSEEAFEKARKGNRPVFLSSGAVWCHWCHVMAKESFYDTATAELLNDNFINIKIDRDELPHIDRRYQMAVAAMGQGGGWPLSVFLTPEKKPFFGGTYFPPEDSIGRPGLKKVIKAVSEFYRTKKDEIYEYTGSLIEAIRPFTMSEGEVSESQLDKAAQDILSEFDPQNGGFGTAPKFPMPGAIEFLTGRYFIARDESAGSAVRKTLESMAAGGIRDHIGGGFHRYSTDKAWIVPHFEKMADDNAWLLRNYLNAYTVFGDDFFREAALDIIGFIKNVLSDPEGGFYASQDADVTPDDEGGYFTWTDRELRKALDEEEYRMLSLHLLHEAGSMHHDRTKKVLFTAMGAKEVAEETGRDIAEVMEVINRGRQKLINERNKRKAPFIDKTLYTSINGMLISVFLHGYRILKDRTLKDFAMLSLEKTMKSRMVNDELFHSEGTAALLDDYICLVDALIAAYEATADASFLDRAAGLMETCIAKLWDSDERGFFDTDEFLLGLRIKEIEDNPRPSANSLSIRLMLKLHDITGEEIYHEYAGTALKAFNERAAGAGVHAGYYFSVLDTYYSTVKLTLCAHPESELAETALSLYNPLSSIVYGEDKGYVIPCRKGVCHTPISDPAALKRYFNFTR